MDKRVQITGRVNRVDESYTRYGVRVIHFRVYDPSPPGCWRSVVLSGDLAESFGSRISRGTVVRVSGSLQSRRSTRGEFVKTEEIAVLDSTAQLDLFPSNSRVAV